VTQDHANSRAMTHHWPFGLPPRGIPLGHSTSHHPCFFNTPARSRAGYFANNRFERDAPTAGFAACFRAPQAKR
jgi:hypothetical protein